MRTMNNGLKAALAGAVLLAAGGCSAQFRNHGYVPADDDLGAIRVGVDTRDTVTQTIGAPSTGGVMDQSGYYYVQSRIRHFAWRAPEVVSREVVAISFDPGGAVRNIERFGLERGRVVPLSRRITENGARPSFLRGLLAKLGQFSAADVLN